VGAGPSWFPFGKGNLWFSLADLVLLQLHAGNASVPAERGTWSGSWLMRERRSAAGEWLPWFPLGGGPPDLWEVPDPVVVSRPDALPGGGVPPDKVFYAASESLGSSSASVALSRMICSVSLGVYPHATSWVR